jgi:hypothetical protein
MTYASVVVACAISFGVLVVETWRARGGAASAGTVTIVGLRGTRGFHLAWWGMAIVILAAPVDDLWHRLFGLDVTLWSPPRLVARGLPGSNLGTLLIALEVYAAGWARWWALVTSGVFLLGTFYIAVDQSVQTAFVEARCFSSAFRARRAVLHVRAGPGRAARDKSRDAVRPDRRALLVQISILLIGDLGFALLRADLDDRGGDRRRSDLPCRHSS